MSSNNKPTDAELAGLSVDRIAKDPAYKQWLYSNEGQRWLYDRTKGSSNSINGPVTVRKIEPTVPEGTIAESRKKRRLSRSLRAYGPTTSHQNYRPGN